MTYRLHVMYGHPSDPAAFDAYYEGTHAPIATQIPDLLSVEIMKAAPDPEGNQPPYYLIAALTFPSAEAMAAALGSPAGQAALADVANFADGGVTTVSGPVVKPL
ncbi:EthD family reductase [Gordonia iterans]|uniref:EthD family reductase n=1 Tax=Gordonia iterans TaxID=1004901 RepID=A0A2S0KE50_9ACTN|nr:EthD family reductase [Gordonia iterans]AVL99959.1 EthD family reductase [Gordonia iterans]